MAYNFYDETKPDPAADNGTAFGTNIRINTDALRDAVVAGTFQGFDMSVSGGTAEQPALILYTKSTEIVRASITWGSAGGATDNAEVILYEFSSDTGGSYDTIGTLTITYDSSSNATATTWS